MTITDRPVALVLAKQNLPILEQTARADRDAVARGAYVLIDPPETPDAVIIATGSEVALAVDAHHLLAEQHIHTRVVSMPSWALFEEQDQAYRDSVLPPGLTARVAVEQAAALGWERYVGARGKIIAMTGFGASGPGDAVRAHFGFTAAAIADTVREVVRAVDAELAAS
jgi:transketolase